MQAAALVFGGDHLGDELAVAAQGVAEIEAAHEFDRGFGLVAMEQIEGHQDVGQQGHRAAGLEGGLAEAGHGGGADVEQAQEFVGGVGPGVPVVALGVDAGFGDGVLLGDGVEAGAGGVFDDAVEAFGFLLGRGAGGELVVAPGDGDFVPAADLEAVGCGEVDAAVAVELEEGGGIVADRHVLAQGAGDVVVVQAEGVADFVGGELAQAGHHQFVDVRAGGAVRVGGEQGLGDHAQVAVAQRGEGDDALQDFAGARVPDHFAVGEAAGGAGHPGDDVVADVDRVGVLGEEFDLEGVAEAGGLEGRVPPAGAFEEGGAHRLGGAAVDVVEDRLDGFTDGGRGVAFFEAVAQRVVDIGREFEGAGEVVEDDAAEEGGARVEQARLEAGFGEADEAGAHADGDGAGVGREGGEAFDLAVAEPEGQGLGARVAEGEDAFDLGVQREGAGAFGGDGRAGGVDGVGALAGFAELARDVEAVAQEKGGGVEEISRLGAGLDVEGPENRFGEGGAHGALLGGLGGGAAPGVIGGDEEEFGAALFEADDLGTAEIAAFEAIVAHGMGEPVDIEEFGAGFTHQDGHRAGGFVAVERHEAVGQAKQGMGGRGLGGGVGCGHDAGQCDRCAGCVNVRCICGCFTGGDYSSTCRLFIDVSLTLRALAP